MRFCVLKMISVAFCIFVSSVYATEPTRLSIANNTNLLKSISRILVEKNSRTVAQRKISSHLLKTKEDLKVGVKQFQNKTNSVPSFVVNSLGVTYCKVVIRAEVTDSLVKKLQSHGAVDIKTHPRWKTISCRIPADEMEKIAEDSSVYSIREQTRPILNKANTSEGVSAHQIDKAVSRLGVTGKGVKIGVISDSVRFLNDVQASGDLPDVTVLPGHDGASYDKNGNRIDTGEGTAMLEIVHDVAPEAELYFATASPTDAQFADNIIALQKEGCHIIVDDVGYFNEPAFQDGIIAQAVNEVRSKGCLYFSAAGNSGNKKLSKSGTYEGDFVPFGTQIINGEEYEYHSFDGKEATKFYCGRSAVTLQWADQWGGSENDYALLLFTADGNVIGFSDDVQNGSEGSCPYEIVRCCGDESCAHNSFGYLYVLKKKNAARRYFRIDTLRGSLEVSTSGSTYGHSAAESAVCVGAASALNGVFSSASTMEDYSSDGPRRIFYNPDGSAITPGNFLSTGGKILKKVDITAGDYVSCATPGFADFPGFNPFPGTSAAAPHAAAIAALMLQARPDLTQEEIVEIMGNTAWRLNGHDSPWDELSGRGIVNALAAVEEAMYYGLPSAATPSLTPSTTFFGNKTVYVTCEDSSATVRYTTDGTVPAESSPEFPASGLVVNETKTISIRAFKDGCRPSSTASATYTKGTIPSCPSVTISGTTMTWTAPTGAKYYKVYRSTNPYADPEAVTGWQTSRSYTITKPSTEGTAYFYFVKASPAQDDAMAGPFNPVRVVTGDGRYTLLQYSTSRNYSVKNADTEFHLYGSGSISDTPYSQQSIAAASSSVKFTKSTGSGITVRANGYDISNNPSVSGGIIARWTMDVSASANTSTAPKSYSFYSNATAPSGFSSTAGGTWAQHYMNWIGRPHYIYQAGKAAFSVGATSQSVDAEEGIYSLKITATPTTTSWTASTSDDWISLYRTSSTGSGVLGFVVSKNEGSARTGTITLKGASKTVTFTISQSGGEVAPAAPVISSVTTTDSSSVKISWGAVSGVTRYDLYRSTSTTRPSSAYKTNVTSPYSDTGATPGTTYYYWVSAVNSAGVSYSGYKSGKRAETLTISSSSVSASASGKNGTVSVTANCGWMASKNVSWITVSPTSGSGNGTLSYTIAANTTAQSRSGTITVTSSGGITRIIAVSQEGLPMYEVTFNSNGGTLSGDATRNVVSGAVIGALPTPIRDGYTFLGWFTAAEGGEKVTESTVVTGNMTLYAQWEEYAGVDDDGYALASMFEYEMCAEGVRITKYKGSAAVVNIPPTIDGFSVISIDDYAFMDCNSLTSVTIPEGVQSIGAMAFRNCGSLTHVSIPHSVVEIGSSPFIYSNYSLFSWDGKGTQLVDGWVVGSTDSPAMWDVDLDLIGVRGICEGAFYSKDYITSVVIPGSVMCVGGNTFRFCSSLTNVMVCSGVKSIGECAFGECGSLTKVTISDSVTNIAQNAFYGCSELVFVMIPLTLKEQIEARDVFADCSSDLQIDYYCTVTFNANGGALSEDGAIEAIVDETIGTLPIPTRDGYTFLGWFTAAEGGTRVTESTVVTGDVTYYAHWEEEGSDGGGEEYTPVPMFEYEIQDGGVIITKYIGEDTIVNIPPFIDGSPVVSIGEEAFYNCTGLTSVLIPNSVTSIGSYAFYNCTGLTSVSIPNSVTSIGGLAFSDCSGLTSVTIPNSVTSIGDDAFADCSSLTRFIVDLNNSQYKSVNGLLLTIDGKTLIAGIIGDVVIPQGVMSIGDSAFSGRDGLTSVTIPDSVTSIGRYAFSRCGGFNGVTIPDSVTSIGDYAFEHCDGLMSVTIPDSVMSIGNNVFYSCDGLTSVTIPDSVMSIGRYAFFACDGLTSVTIPDSVTSIGYCAFANCSGLTSVTIPDSVTSIGNKVFYSCKSLTYAKVPLALKEQVEVGKVFSNCSSNLQIDYYCIVTFNANGGALSEDGAIEAIVGETIGILPTPTRDGYIFLGWFTAAEGGEQVTADTVVTGDMTLYAQWEKELKEPSFEIDENGVLSSVELNRATEIIIPSNVKVIAEEALSGCCDLTSVTIPEGVVSIGYDAFNCCCALTSINIPSTVTNIGENAFGNCTNLRIVTGGEGLKRVGIDAFYDTLFLYGEDSWEDVESNEDYMNDYGLDLVRLGNFIVGRRGSLEEARNDEYYDEEGNWTWEYNLVIPEGTTGMADGLFAGVPITSVEIPGSVKRIPESAFGDCCYLKDLTINEGVEEIGADAFGCAGCNWGEDGITTLSVPSSVAKIGEYAFRSFGNLKYVVGLDDTDDVSMDAFIWTPYVDGWQAPVLNIEDGVVYGYYWETRFDDGCITNGTLYIPEGVTNIAEGAFGYESSFEKVVLPEGVVSIGNSTFSYCAALTSINIPSTVTNIGENAFGNCTNLRIVTGGEGLKRVGIDAFYDTLFLYGEDSWEDVEANEDYANGYGLDLVQLGNFIVGRCGSLAEAMNDEYYDEDGDWMWEYNLVIPEGTSGMADGLFAGVPITSVEIPGSVKRIPESAFGDCCYLKDLIINEGVEEIGAYAFSCAGCNWGEDGITTLVIPLSVTKIEENAFADFGHLKYVTGLNDTDEIHEDAFNGTPYIEGWEAPVLIIEDGVVYGYDWETRFDDGCITNGTLYIPEGVTNVADCAFKEMNEFSKAVLPSSLRSIGHEAFYDCEELREIEGDVNLESVGYDAFYDTLFLYGEDSWEDVEANEDYANGYGLDLVRLGNFIVGRRGSLAEAWNDEYYDEEGNWTWEYNLVIPEGTTGLADGLFAGVQITSVEIPGSVKRIPYNAFYSCSYLDELTLDEGIEEIAYGAFEGCSYDEYGIESVVIPSSVKKIGEDAFRECDRLKYVTGIDDTDEIHEDAFMGTPYVEGWEAMILDIEDGNVVGIKWETRFDDGCVTNGTLYIPEGVTNIATSAVSGNSEFCNVNLPDTLQSIGDGAFSCCELLIGVTIPNGVVSIGVDAFESCGLESVFISESVASIGAGAFYSCSHLTNIIIPENVVSIGEEVFAYCDNLTYARVPLALKTQVEEGNVFADCSPDLQIEYYDNAPLVAPVITPADGTEFYEDSCTVTITCETDGATIYYTTDGTTPRPRPANLYTGPFEIDDTTTVKAIAVKGDERTDLVSATIVRKEIVLAAPVITPADGTEFYEDSCMVTISCATEGASIYYTVCDTNNVTNPRPSERNLYTGPFTVSATKMVRAFSMFGSKTSDIISATLIKRELTLPVAVDAPALTFTTGGDAQWTPVFDGSAKVGGSLAQSGALSWSEEDDDPSVTWMETTVAGAGTFSFWWKVDCEDDPWGATWDHLKVSTNGVEIARIDGKTEWEQLSFTFNDVGTHTIRWTFCKDDWDDEKLPDIAWVDGVIWTPASTDITVGVGNGKNVVVPVSWIDKYGDILAAAGGDKTAALLRTAANGRKVWECFMLGVDPTKADDDFKITRFWMENGKPMFEYSHTSDGAGRSFVSRIRKLGTQTLDDPWQEVPSEGNPLFRFFTVEVQLP